MWAVRGPTHQARGLRGRGPGRRGGRRGRRGREFGNKGFVIVVVKRFVKVIIVVVPVIIVMCRGPTSSLRGDKPVAFVKRWGLIVKPVHRWKVVSERIIRVEIQVVKPSSQIAVSARVSPPQLGRHLCRQRSSLAELLDGPT